MLHIVVCVKQVPDSTQIRIDPKTNTLVRIGVPAIVNYYDLHGLEEALVLKEKYGARITVVSMGPPPAEKALKQCISLGADEAVLITDRAFAGADTLATSYVLAAAIKKVEETWGHVDIVFTGKQTLDGDTGQVGPGIACRLDVEQLTYVNKVVGVNVDTKRITVHRLLEDGTEVVETKLPVLMTALKELNKVRRASMPGMLRAAQYKAVIWTVADFPNLDRAKIGLKGSPTVVGKTWVPEIKAANTEMLEGDAKSKVSTVFDKIWETELPAKFGWDQPVNGRGA